MPTSLLLNVTFSTEGEPLFVFGVIMLMILLSQVFLQRLRIPSLVGYILSGVALGPEGFGLFNPEGGIALLGAAGLLYIMFTARLELNLVEFRKKTGHSLLFGFFTFILPLAIGYPVCIYLLHLKPLGALMVSSMFSTHTLVAYPIVMRYKLQKNEAVATAVGGTIFTDTAVLLLLAFIVAFHEGKGGSSEMIKIALLALTMVTFIIIVYPKLGRWFFRHNSEDRTSGMVFLLTLMFAAGMLSKVIGLEPIIGAFLAGIALNRQVAGNHILHQRVEFLGASLFIPFFLISVGMVVDLKLLLGGTFAWYIAGLLTVVALLGKWLAAWMTQKFLFYTALQRKLIFGLSSSHAAATIAVIFIGYKIGLIDIHILNGTILLILATCLIATMVTESAARKIAIQEVEDTTEEVPALPDRVLVPVANPATAGRLIEVALAFRDKTSDKESVFALALIEENGPGFEDRLQQTRKFLNDIAIAQAEHEKYLRTLLKIDINVVSGIIKTMKEISASHLVLGWGGLPTTADRLFGNLLERIISMVPEMIIVTRHRQPIHNFNTIQLWVPPNAEYETGFLSLARKLIEIAFSIQARLEIYSEKNLSNYFSLISQKTRFSCECKYIPVNTWSEGVLTKPKPMSQDTLFAFVMARRGTLSFHNIHEELPHFLNSLPDSTSFMVIYPEQSPIMRHSGVIPAEEIFNTPLTSRFSKIRKKFHKIFSLLRLNP
ncbi:MAG: hypothetical protein PWR20_1485 [Bacteroidales bacterium]|jgi:Kef-type K+ transport system membrane component KefB|nr:hypothetical protein [Bacteroidales bacterium]